MDGTERLSPEELDAVLGVATATAPDPGNSALTAAGPDELKSGRDDRLTRSELLTSQVLGFLRRHRLPAAIGLVIAIAAALFAGWYVAIRTPPIDPTIHARVRYVSTYSSKSVSASTGDVVSASLRTTLRIISDDPTAQIQITGLDTTGGGPGADLPPIQVTQDGTSVILITAFPCPVAIPDEVDLRLRVVRIDKWGRPLAGELPILPGVGGDLLSGRGIGVPQPTDPNVNPLVDVINHYCAQANTTAYKSTLTIEKAP